MAHTSNPFNFNNIGGGRGDLNHGGGSGSSSRPGNQPSLYCPTTICQLCNTPGHTAAQCRRRRRRRCSALFANSLASPFPLRQPHPHPHPRLNDLDCWVVDSGSSHHVTPDPANIPVLSERYDDGAEAVIRTAGGSRHPISHRGTSYIASPSGSTFMLSDVLCVPDAVDNFLSVREFTRANGVSVEFFPAYFVVKDRDGAPVGYGLWSDGLYRLYLEKRGCE